MSLRYYPAYSQSQFENIKNDIETKLIKEYNLIKTLDKKNINVTYYVNGLNLIIDTLKSAEKYYLIGDEQNANSRLNIATSLLDKMDNDLKVSLDDYYSKEMGINISRILTPIIATLLVTILSLAFWIFYKKYYYIKLFKMKPEVNKIED